jgi:chitodextrinase
LDTQFVNDLCIPADQELLLPVTLSNSGLDQQATLTIEYGLNSQAEIRLFNEFVPLDLTNPGTQFNSEGDQISLQIQANGNQTLEYSATGLPPVLNINPNTGVISGTISDGDCGAEGGVFQEENGLIVVEAESSSLVPTWSLVQDGDITAIQANDNNFANPLGGGKLTYKVNINTPGVYRLDSNNAFSGGNPTEENDAWLRINNSDDVWFFGFRGDPVSEANLISILQGSQSNVVFPSGAGPGGVERQTAGTEVEGNSSDGFLKVFRQGGSSGVYGWNTFTNDNLAHPVYVWFVNPGTYDIEIAERSAGHRIDKFVLYKLDGPAYTDGQLSDLPESSTCTGGEGAASGSPYSVSVQVTDPNNPSINESIQFEWVIGSTAPDQKPNAEITASTAQVTLGSAINFSGASSTDPDGNIEGYNWNLGNGELISQASFDYTYPQPGTYTVTLTVIDNDGNSDQDQLTVTVLDPNAPQEGVVSFTMFNAETDQVLSVLSPGQQIQLSEIQGIPLSITAQVEGSVGSVVMNLSGTKVNTRTESVAPYALFGDTAGDFTGETFGLGNYTIQATAFSSSGGNGEAVGVPLSLTFSIVENVQVNNYTITASAGSGGSISPSGSVTVQEGGSQGFTITAEAGFQIDDVLVNGISQGSIGSFTFNNVNENSTISASFVSVPVTTYTIAASAGNGGSISPSGSVSVIEGGSQEFTITAEAGFEIDDVLVDGVSQGPISSFTFSNVNKDATISASFNSVPVTTYTITASAGNGGSISPSGSVTVAEGESQTFNITANSGFEIDEILVDGQPVSNANSFTFNDVQADASIVVSFKEAEVPEPN